MKRFEKDGLSYRCLEKIGGGSVWQCDYHDCRTARIFVAKKDLNRSFIVRSFEIMKEEAEIEAEIDAEIDEED